MNYKKPQIEWYTLSDILGELKDVKEHLIVLKRMLDLRIISKEEDVERVRTKRLYTEIDKLAEKMYELYNYVYKKK